MKKTSMRFKKAHLLKPAFFGTLAGVAGVSGAEAVQAQSFDSVQVNPFGLSHPLPYSVKPAFTDLDGDGDYDVLAGNYYGSFIYYSNIGTPTAPSFDTAQVSPFSLTGVYYYSTPALVDLDADGDLDLLSGAVYGDLFYYENTGTANAPSFGPVQQNPFGLVTSQISYGSAPTFGDLDNDGDQDLLVGSAYSGVYYYENTGSDTMPAFAAPLNNPFGVVPLTNYILSPQLVDLDGDGDLDIMATNADSNVEYFENTGTASAPAFATGVVNPFNIEGGGYQYAIVSFADLDGDSDLDLLLGSYYGDFLYQENLSSTNSAPVITAGSTDTICQFDPLQFPFLATDADGDSLTFMVTSSDQGVIPDISLAVTGTPPNFEVNGTPSASGTTTITVSAMDGTDTTNATFDVFVDACVSLDESFFADRFVVYPNPTDGQFRVELELLNRAEQLDFQLLDPMGRMVMQRLVEPQGLSLSEDFRMGSLAAGVYHLRVSSGVFVLNRKIVVE